MNYNKILNTLLIGAIGFFVYPVGSCTYGIHKINQEFKKSEELKKKTIILADKNKDGITSLIENQVLNDELSEIRKDIFNKKYKGRVYYEKINRHKLEREYSSWDVLDKDILEEYTRRYQ